MIKISVITPSFNSGSTIARAIESVRAQDYLVWEHIIVDGVSTDNTAEIVKSYDNVRFISEPDRGQTDAMVKGFDMATGDVIVYLNADDCFLPHAFSSVIAEFKKGASFVVGNVEVRSRSFPKIQVNRPKTGLKDMLRHWKPNAFCYNPVGYFYRREVQQQCPFNPNNDLTMDLEFLLDAAAHFKFTKIDKSLGCYYADEQVTKSYKSQFADGHWSPETFAFIDKHLMRLSPLEREKFKIERAKGYRKLEDHWRSRRRGNLALVSWRLRWLLS